MATMTVPTVPALSHLPGVELCQTGTWQLSTGPATFTPNDFMAAVAALDCPAMRRPVLKLGHDGNFGVGQPAIGYIDNLRGADDWRTLVGDYAGMPGWLATPDANGGTVIASAYPDRSIEGAWDWTCQMGHTHPFVILAVSLLGAELPGVGTLASLNDVATLYGVDGAPELVAAAAAQADGSPDTFVVPVSASRKDPPMPNPTARQVSATVTSDDVRRAFYESPVGSDWDAWIEEIQLDPLQIIYIDDGEGARYRVPVTIGAGDGPDAVSFGEPVKVVIRYQDAGVAAAAGQNLIRFATRAESRPGDRPAASSDTPADQPVTPPTDHKEADTMSDTIPTAGLVKALGLADDADEDAILDALDAKLTAAPPAAVPEPVAASTGDATELALLRRELETANGKIAELVTARASDDTAKKADKKRDLFAAAFTAGKIGGPSDPERVEFEKDYDEAPAVIERILASRAAGSKFPVRASGYGTDETTATDPASDDNYWFPGAAKPRSALATAGD